MSLWIEHGEDRLFRVCAMWLAVMWAGCLWIEAADEVEPSVAVWQTEDGRVYLANQTGPRLFEAGEFAAHAIQLGLPRPSMDSVNEVTAPIAVRVEGMDRVVVVRAVPEVEGDGTTIFGVSAPHAWQLDVARVKRLAWVEDSLEQRPRLWSEGGSCCISWVGPEGLQGAYSLDGEVWIRMEEHVEEEPVGDEPFTFALDPEEVWRFQQRWGDVLGPVFVIPETLPFPWVVKIHDSGYAADQVFNVVITCEGFTLDQQADFMNQARQLAANLVDRAPWHFNQDLFNVYAMSVCSRQSGCDSSQGTDDRDTAFDAYRVAGTPMVIPRVNPMDYAAKLITGDPLADNIYGFVIYNPPAGQTVAVLPWDDVGVPLAWPHVQSVVAIHEFMHTRRFDLGDHDRRVQGFVAKNKTDDGSTPLTGSHPWEAWFADDPVVPSRRIPVSWAYRSGLQAWVADGHALADYSLYHAPYEPDPSSPFYVSALDLFNVNLWESPLPDVPDLDAEPLYFGVYACAMNSLWNNGHLFCPICSECVLKTLHDFRNTAFSVSDFQDDAGAILEIQLTHLNARSGSVTLETMGLDQAVRVNGVGVPVSAFTVYPSEHGGWVHHLARLDLSPWINPGESNQISFTRPSGGGTSLWIPGLQVLNDRGARYPMWPVGPGCIERLHLLHPAQCDFGCWDLTQGDLTVEFRAN